MATKITKEEFLTKYGFPRPFDARERDMIILSNLSDLNFITKDRVLKFQINNLKEFMLDTKYLIK